MVSDDSIFIKHHPAISIVCTILITYPNMMWIPWNVSSLLPDEVAAFWATLAYRCAFFFGLFYLQIGFNVKSLNDVRFIQRFWKNLLYSAVAALIFVMISCLIPILSIQSATVGKYLMFQFLMVPLICTFIGYISILNDIQLTKEKEIEALKIENLQSRYNALANQINPHFFFNSLGGISSLVRRGDEDVTLEYIDRLADIFRYILKNDTDRLVPLSNELRFAEAFNHVMTVRLGGKLNIEMNIEKDNEQRKLPVLSLLPLLENISTHNRIDSDHRMTVSIFTKNGWLVISNPIFPKTTKSETNGTGLENLNQRFNLLTGKMIVIEKSENQFIVKLPL